MRRFSRPTARARRPDTSSTSSSARPAVGRSSASCAMGTDFLAFFGGLTLGCGGLLMNILAPAEERRHSTDDTHDGGGDEDDDQTVVEGPGDQLWEELLARQDGAVHVRRAQDAGRPEQALDGVVPEERSEQRADGR